MPRFRFRGFSTGVPVDLSATQGTSTDSGAVPEWRVSTASPISLSLSATRVTGTAPMGVILTATATSPAARVDSPFHDIEYVWSFDDPGTFSALNNAPIWGNDRNVAYGPHTAHVFEAPGTYMVICTAHDGENPPRSETIEIVVAAPNTVYAADNTAVVSLAGDFSGAPAGAQAFTSLSAAISMMQGRQDWRILLRRGETHTTSHTVSVSSGTGKRIAFGAFGSGSNPFFDGTNSESYALVFNVAEGVADEISVRDIDYEGPYDPTLTGQSARGGGIVNFASTAIPLTAHKTVWGCHAKNSGNTVLDLSTGDTIENIYVGNCWFDGWRDYGMLIGDGGWVGICGSKLLQPPGSRNGPGKSNDYPDHGPFRVSRPTNPVVLTNVDFSSYNDWSTGTDYSMQPVTRWNASVPDQRFVVDRMRSEGGAILAANVTTNFVAQNVYALIDRFYCVLTSHQAITINHGGVTYRNGIIIAPDIIAGGGTGIQGSGVLTEARDNTSRRVEAYSCAAIDLRNDRSSQRRDGGSSVRDFAIPSTGDSTHYFGNWLGYCPNRSSVPNFLDHMPLDTSDGEWLSGYGGEAYEAQPLDTSQTYGQDHLATFRPLTGSAAIGGASGKVSLLDFDGNLRSEVLSGLNRSAPSLGPYEPALES